MITRPDSLHPSTIYDSELRCFHEGRAQWFPEPHSTGEVQIGDVGYIKNGQFVRLLNVCQGVAPIGFWPKRFKDVEPVPNDILLVEVCEPFPSGRYYSEGVEEVQIEGSGKVYVFISCSLLSVISSH